jgi:hypothetical protein
MINKAKNKDMAFDQNKSNKQEFFFSGGGQYQAQNILAENIEEATAQFNKTKVKL